ncbi:uncharacterized protein GGS25DRAFT_519575 [Hypoxylon fragiforme]|uniref:uncharacterized protein n=1 Tax=Hypoxylon fragiforme TaxID=63214 RepID=UPI0020C71534|nr:uncharacterized protein GGS25DRAFT_519575 [Hypoxylon fragiforme]KAI2611274.1 hypothetical protein GGS25DRAFT_519575 [Hypoxylon fragiforme]
MKRAHVRARNLIPSLLIHRNTNDPASSRIGDTPSIQPHFPRRRGIRGPFHHRLVSTTWFLVIFHPALDYSAANGVVMLFSSNLLPSKTPQYPYSLAAKAR